MNRQAEGFMARQATLPAAGVGHPHESAHLHVAGEALYVDDIPEIAGTLHAALGLSEKAHARIRSIDLAAVRAAPGVVAVLTAADIPGRERLRSHHPRRSDPRRRPRPVRRPADVRRVAATYDAARRAARLAKVDYDVLPPVLTPQEAKRLQSYVLPPMHLERGDPGTAMAAAPRRMSGEFYVGGQEQFYLEGQISYAVPKEDGVHPPLLLDAASDGDAARRRARARARREPGDGRDAADGRRLRRQGIAVGALRVRRAPWRRNGCAAGQDPARPRRRLHGHRQAPLLPLRVRSRLRRRWPDPRREGRDGGARRLLGGPLGAGVHARGLSLRQHVLPARRGHPGAGRQDQHAVEYRVSRLRRTAGRDRDRIHHRQHRARAWPRSARCPQGELLRHDRAQRHAVRHERRGQRDPRARRRARSVSGLSASAAARPARSTHRARY